jgi:hypothetical protein
MEIAMNKALTESGSSAADGRDGASISEKLLTSTSLMSQIVLKDEIELLDGKTETHMKLYFKESILLLKAFA